jgi:hypothetical protein
VQYIIISATQQPAKIICYKILNFPGIGVGLKINIKQMLTNAGNLKQADSDGPCENMLLK